MAISMSKMLKGGKKKTPQLGGANPNNIDTLVAAGILTEEEGRKAKQRWREKNKKNAG